VAQPIDRWFWLLSLSPSGDAAAWVILCPGPNVVERLLAMLAGASHACNDKTKRYKGKRELRLIAQ
jgi:hypothetical protein